MARKMHFKLSILSNASLLTPEIAGELSKLYLNFYSLTIFSLKPSIHDRITQVKGSLENALKGVELLAKSGIEVDIKTPIMTDNWKEFYDVKAYCEQHGFSYMASSFLFQKTDLSNEPLSLAIKGEKLEEIIKDINNTNGYNKTLQTDYMCNLLRYSMFINSSGEVFPCNGFYQKMGDIRIESLKKIWNNPNFKKVRNLKKSQLSYCQNCLLEPFCNRCPGSVYGETGDYYGCSPICREVAEAQYHVYHNKEGGIYS